MSDLTDKQRLFVEYYLVSLNAADAARKAGYSEDTAKQMGAQNMEHPDIKAAIDKAIERRIKRTQINQDRILEELARVAFADPRKVMSWGPDGVKLKSSDDLSDDDAALVSEVTETTTATGGSMKVKSHDKLKALELIGRHLGMFPTQISGPNGGPIPVATANVTKEELAQAVASVAEKF